ncbi:hypothetical protein [Azospirillum argentinense]
MARGGGSGAVRSVAGLLVGAVHDGPFVRIAVRCRGSLLAGGTLRPRTFSLHQPLTTRPYGSGGAGPPATACKAT